MGSLINKILHCLLVPPNYYSSGHSLGRAGQSKIQPQLTCMSSKPPKNHCWVPWGNFSPSTAHSVIYTRFYCKLSMCFVSKILRNPTFQRLFPFPLITWQAKHLFQIVILRLRVKLTFGNDRKHPKPNLTWTTNHSLLFILFLPCSHWWVLKDVWTRKYKES